MNYRDGSTVVREPIDIASPGSQKTEGTQAEADTGKKFRGHELEPVGMPAGARAHLEAFLTVHIRRADLEKLESALENFGIQAWVTAGCSEGPKLTTLGEYLAGERID